MSKRKYDLKIAEDWIDKTYRYRLDALTGMSGSKRLVAIQLNPSKAGSSPRGAIRSDATVGKVAIWAIENEFSSVSFLNLFAFISTPQQGLSGVEYPHLVGPRNDSFINEAVENKSTIVLAWGEPDSEGLAKNDFERRVSELRKLLAKRSVFVMGPLVDGVHPRHGKCWNRPHRELRPYQWD